MLKLASVRGLRVRDQGLTVQRLDLLNRGKQITSTPDNNMVNGPPTPPATTAIELQDEARENPPISDASTSLPLDRTENYQHVLASIVEAISNKDYPQVINIAQETDYEVLGSFISVVVFVDSSKLLDDR